jgi:ABC-type phosphate/phosphonate transport system permease subunit
MFRPSTGGHLQSFLKANSERLSVALLGTLAAAGLAMPLALLAAKSCAQ